MGLFKLTSIKSNLTARPALLTCGKVCLAGGDFFLFYFVSFPQELVHVLHGSYRKL